MLHRITNILAVCITATTLHAQSYKQNEVITSEGTIETAHEGLSVDAEMQASISNAKTPLWLNANKFGISTLNPDNGYLRGSATYDKAFEDGKYELTAGMDVILPIGYKSYGYSRHHTSSIFIQQAFVEGRYKLGSLTIGAKQQPMELKNNELSSGSQALGINARPVPQVRIGLRDYWTIPVLNSWFAFKGHMAYGVMTDGSWAEDFAFNSGKRYNKNTRYHEKAGYLRIGNNEKVPLSLTLGLEMASQFGGDVYSWVGSDEMSTPITSDKYTLSSSMKSYWTAFIGMATGDTGEGIYKNTEGNQLGSWVARLDWTAEEWCAGIYFDHFFEDHSGMFLLDYDGYGTGSEWNVKKDNRFFGYSLKDMLLGADIKLKGFKYINQAVVEYMNTRYQSGPVYHDRTEGNQTHISGRDQYYNHYCLPGWQHWGQVMGNPLYLSPLYNTDGNIGTYNNRFYAWHFAIAGDPAEGLHYRAKLSWQRGWGTYEDPYVCPKENTSILLEVGYRFADNSTLRNLGVKAAYGADFGKIRGNNSGCQFTIHYNIR